MQHEPIQVPWGFLFGAPMLYGGGVDALVKLHDGWHRLLLRSLLVLQGEYAGDAVEAEALVPKLAQLLHQVRAKIPAEFHATDPDRLIAASAKRCVKNAGRIVVRTPRWAMDN